MKSLTKKIVVVICGAVLSGCAHLAAEKDIMATPVVNVPCVPVEVLPTNYVAVKSLYVPINKKWYKNPKRERESLLRYIEDLERNNNLLECVMSDKDCTGITDKEEDSE